MATASAEAVEKIPEWLRDNGEEIEVVKPPELRRNRDYIWARDSIARRMQATVSVMRFHRKSGKAKDAGNYWLEGSLSGEIGALISLRIGFNDWTTKPVIQKRREVSIDPDALAAVAC